MKRSIIILCFLACLTTAHSQQNQEWVITASGIDPKNYFGVTVANGMIGLVSSPEPMKVKDVVLNGVYDNYQRGRVSNILKTFNHINMSMDVDGHRIGAKDMHDYKQTLDMKKAALTTSFAIGDKITVRHTIMALRHLPYTAMAIIEIKAIKAVRVV